MNCNDIQTAISAYVDGELSGTDATAMFAHLSGCPECQAFLTDTLRLRADIRAWEVRIPPPSPARRAVLEREERPHGPIRRLIAQRLEMPFAAAAGIALVLLGVSLFSLSLLLSGSMERGKEPEVVYMLTLPAVEVRAVQPAAQKPAE